MDGAVTNGAKGIGQMMLTNADLQPLYDEARKNAIASAMAKAKMPMPQGSGWGRYGAWKKIYPP